MRSTNDDHELRVETDAGRYKLSPTEQEKMNTDLETLRRLVKDFPVSELKIEISTQSNVRVGTSLRLPGQTIYTADVDKALHPAWERCLRKLVQRVTAYKERLANKPTYQKEAQGTLHNVRPSMDPHIDDVQKAVEELDYPVFRRELGVYEEAIEKRVGRWVERYPDAEARLGNGLVISEIVEEVFLNAFERFPERPPALRLGEWLESLIDPSIQTLLNHPDEEKENLSFIESAKEISNEPDSRASR